MTVAGQAMVGTGRAALLGLLALAVLALARPQPAASQTAPTTRLEAQFRGCDAAGWCRFWIESLDPTAASLYRVRPDGIVPALDNALAVAMRDRLNALLASMIHQTKRIVLQDLRRLHDGTFAATVRVNDADVAEDPLLMQLQQKGAGTLR